MTLGELYSQTSLRKAAHLLATYDNFTRYMVIWTFSFIIFLTMCMNTLDLNAHRVYAEPHGCLQLTKLGTYVWTNIKFI